MPVYFYWGEDDFALEQAVKQLRQSKIDPDWADFNFEQFAGTDASDLIAALNQVMTPVFGAGDRLVWVLDASVTQQSSPELLSELERTLPQIPDNSHLLFTSSKKPDSRLKTTKLLQKFAQFQEFALIPPWETEKILTRVEQVCQSYGVKLTKAASQRLAEAVGNSYRQLHNEVAKLSLYYQSHPQPIEEKTLTILVPGSSQNSLHLAEAMRQGKSTQALGLIRDLLSQNEPPLKIVATLVNQFRTWTIVKLMLEAGERDDKAIAQLADLSNPKRVYFLRQSVQSCPSAPLLSALELLLQLEWELKQGADSVATLQTKIMQICHLF